jgi:integrase
MADELLEQIGKDFKNPKHLTAWQRSIGAPRPIKARVDRKWAAAGSRPCYAEALRPMRVDQITADHVYRLLKPLWSDRNDTAARVRGHIARVLAAAKSAGHRSGDNPAAWEENLKDRLGPRKKLTRGHRPALPYEDLPAFMVALRRRPAMSAKALDFAILTAARLGEIRGATWGEIDLDAKLWIIPAARMKMSRPHRVPLCDDALYILKALALLSNRQPDTPIFPGTVAKRPISEAAMMQLIRRMGYNNITQHGFRSCFRDWAGDATSFPRDIIEQALAHAVGNEVELAYRRSDALERRRKVMERWADYCAGRNEVIELARTA